MNLKIFRRKGVLGFGILILFSALLVLNEFYFVSSKMQNIYYVLYIISSSLVILVLHKNYSIRFHHGILAVFIILLVFISYLNHIIALPMLLIYPLFSSKNSNVIFKIISGILYTCLIFIFFITLFVRVIFTSDKLVHEVNSPNNKYKVEVVAIDEGALGGTTIIKLAKIHCNIFKREKIIYIDRWGKGNNIKWIDNRYVEIDGTMIDINSSYKIDKRH